MKLRQIVTACVFGLVSLSGCADDKEDVSKKRLLAMSGGVEQKPVFPVKGSVKVDGNPAKGVNVILYRADDTRDTFLECRTDQDGKYCFTTSMSCDGVEAGSYLVAFTHIPKPKKNGTGVDLLKGKYRDPKRSKFKLKVEDGVPQEDVNYDLSSK